MEKESKLNKESSL